MRAHDTGQATEDKGPGLGPARAPSPVSAAGADARSPSSLLALQRSVGNAAVAAMIQRAQHQHGAGCGHQQTDPAPVQRTAVDGVLRSAGTPLDEPVREEMESRLGADFSDVRIHTDSAARTSAAEVGARAYTSGSHIVVGEGGADKHTLAHELTHVIQQRQGPVAGTDNGSGLRVSDPSDRFEREAEATATRVLNGPAAGERATVPAQRAAAAKAPVTSTGTAVQRVTLPGRSLDVDYGALSAGGTGTTMRAWLYPNQLDRGS